MPILHWPTRLLSWQLKAVARLFKDNIQSIDFLQKLYLTLIGPVGFQYNLLEPVIILMVSKAYAVHVCNLADIRHKHYTSSFIYYETINGVLWHNVNKVQHSQTTLRHFNSSLLPLLRLLILYKHRSGDIATQQLCFSIRLQIYLHTLK